MIITKLKISDIKLGKLMVESGAPLSRCSAFFMIGKNTLQSYIDAYKDGKSIISHEDIKKAADGETIKSAHIKLKSIGFDKDEQYLAQWCRQHRVRYLSMCRKYKLDDIKKQEILNMLRVGVRFNEIADRYNVCEATVSNIAKMNGIKSKYLRVQSKETDVVIEFLFEAANLKTKKEIVKDTGLTKLKVRSAIQFIINNPADYELIKGKRGHEAEYKITAVSSKRKSKVTNDKKKKVIQMIDSGCSSEEVAIAVKCKVDTVNNIKESTAGRVKITKPDISPMMAMALGMKIK